MRTKLFMLIMLSVCTCAFALPTPSTYISFEDTNFGGATYIDDQEGTSMDGTITQPVAGEINLVDGGVVGKFGQFVNNGWWLRGGDSLAVAHPGANGTVAMWARMDIDAVNQNYPLLWDANPGTNAQGWKVYSVFSSNGTDEPFTLYNRLDSNYWNVASGTVSGKEQWFHYALTWELNEAGDHLASTFYINGVAVSTKTEFYDAYDSEIRIGGGGESLNHTKWQGDMDEVYVFDTALTGSEVTEVMNAVPEPATMALLGLGGLFLRRRRS